MRSSPYPDWLGDGHGLIGAKVRVYWNSRDQWPVGRIIQYNSITKKHLIRYDEDGSTAWYKMENEPAIVARDLIWAKMRSHPWWPAQVYQPSGRQVVEDGLVKLRKGFVYVVYFQTDESGFVKLEKASIATFESRPDLMENKKRLVKLQEAITKAKEEASAMRLALSGTIVLPSAGRDPNPNPKPRTASNTQMEGVCAPSSSSSSLSSSGGTSSQDLSALSSAPSSLSSSNKRRTLGGSGGSAKRSKGGKVGL
ncbi:unnamed protein product, partial [Discosporangium mesarthrocarpum]